MPVGDRRHTTRGHTDTFHVPDAKSLWGIPVPHEPRPTALIMGLYTYRVFDTALPGNSHI